MNVNFKCRPGVPGPTIPTLLVIFFLGFFFQSNRLSQYQETRWTVNEEKKGDSLMTEAGN